MRRLQRGEQLLEDGRGGCERGERRVAHVHGHLRPDAIRLRGSLVGLAFMSRAARLNACLSAADWGGAPSCCGQNAVVELREQPRS